MGIWEWLQRQPREQLVELGSMEFEQPGEFVAAVGEASYQPALRRICGSDRWEDVRCDVKAALVPEPSNRYDPNAVMVQVDGQLVGYHSRGDAGDYGPVIGFLSERRHVIVCDARISGRGPGNETPNLGIFLELPSPDDALAEAERVPLGRQRVELRGDLAGLLGAAAEDVHRRVPVPAPLVRQRVEEPVGTVDPAADRSDRVRRFAAPLQPARFADLVGGEVPAVLLGEPEQKARRSSARPGPPS